MSGKHRTTSVAVAVATISAVIAGCSSSTSGSGSASSSSATSSAASSSANTSSSTAASTPASSSGSGSTSALASSLLTAAEVGAGYSPAATQPTESALPCTPSKPPLFTQAAPADKAQQAFTTAAQNVQISETVAKYAAASGAQQAFTLGSGGFACTRGTIGGQAVQIVKRASGTPRNGVDEFAAWDFGDASAKGTAVLVRLGSRLVAMIFVATGTAGNSVPVGTIVDRAAAKVKASG